jgi:hypothetical protein
MNRLTLLILTALLLAPLAALHAADAPRPVANAGADVTINSDRYHLNAGQSQDSTGLANCRLLWTQAAGPQGATISHPTAATTPIIDMNMGVYTFRVTITGVPGTDYLSLLTGGGSAGVPGGLWLQPSRTTWHTAAAPPHPRHQPFPDFFIFFLTSGTIIRSILV